MGLRRVRVVSNDYMRLWRVIWGLGLGFRMIKKGGL